MPVFRNINELTRQNWLEQVLTSIAPGSRLLDAGAGELRNKKYCSHLTYTSQDFCEFHGTISADGNSGLPTPKWDVSAIDIKSDICSIPAADESYDVILCSEVLEHVPEPTQALDEFARLLRPGGLLIITAPFSSNVHMAPFHFSTGFTEHWYRHHLPLRGLTISDLQPNGDWFLLLRQELIRLGSITRNQHSLLWPLAYLYGLVGAGLIGLTRRSGNAGLACFGFHCIAFKA